MQNRLIKQLIYYFVLPSAIFIIAFSIFVITGHMGIEPKILFPVILLMWIAYCAYIINLFSKGYKQVNHALQELKEGNTLDLPVKASTHLFGPVLDSLEHISIQMKFQQEELQKERTNRLRSVIDGQDIERSRLSRELHDGLGQSLIAVKLQLESAGSQGHSQMRATIDVAKGMIDSTIDEVRRVTNALLPAALIEFGLVTALRARCEEMGTTAGLKVSFENSGALERLENKSKTYLYRIAQEAITNAIKHARAQELEIKLIRLGQEVILQVSDNGKGFIFDPIRFAHRNGLQNIRERVALLNGKFDLNSKLNSGTCIKVTIPYKTGNGKNTDHFGG